MTSVKSLLSWSVEMTGDSFSSGPEISASLCVRTTYYSHLTKFLPKPFYLATLHLATKGPQKQAVISGSWAATCFTMLAG